MASESYPLVIRKYRVEHRKPELQSEQVFRYDADTNIVEQKDYQVLDIYDEEAWEYVESKYLTRHVISEYDEKGCYHRVECSRDELDRHADDPFEDVDTTFFRVEYFYSTLADGKNQHICLTAEDSIVRLFDSNCCLLGSKTYLRATGQMYEREDVTWSEDSLELHCVRYEPFETYHTHEVYNKEGDRTLFENEYERQTIRYWYRANGEIYKSYMRNYELRNGKWKLTDYSWIYPKYRHGYTEVNGLGAGAAISIREKYNKHGDLVSSYEVVGVACLIPFTTKYVYEYEYPEDSEDSEDPEDSEEE